VNRYQYVEATIKDVPRVEKVEAILLMNLNHPEEADRVALIGDINRVEAIIGRSISPEKIISDPVWIKKIHQHYLEARRVNNFGRGSFNDSRVVFITKKRAYMIEFGVDDENGKYTIVYGDDYESAELRKDFEELGLLDEEEPYDGIPGLEYLKK